MDIPVWLRGLGLEQYMPAFRDNDIDGEVLRRLTGEDLRELGVTSIGHRRRLLDAIAALADDRLLLRRAFADQIANDHQSGCDPDARSKFDGFDVKATDSDDGRQPRPDSTLGVVFLCSRVAEIDQDAVAHVS